MNILPGIMEDSSKELKARIKILEQENQDLRDQQANSEAENSYNSELENLRAEIWKIAAQAVDEKSLIQDLLDIAGPVLRVENISYMPYFKKEKEIIIGMQWRADGQETGLGDAVPSWIFKQFKGRPYIKVEFDELPAIIQPIIKPFRKKYGTKSSLLIPYGDANEPDGYLSAHTYTYSKNFSTREIQVFIELARIIHVRSKELSSQNLIRASEERLNLALHGADLGLWDWNLQSGEVVFNERWSRMLGYSPEEIKGHVSSWEGLLHPDDISMVREVLNMHLQGKTPFYQTEHRMRAKDGSWKWILDKGKVLEWDKDGNPLRATGTHLDISERKAAEQELILVNKTLQEEQKIFSAGPAVLFKWKSDTNWPVEFVSENVEQVFGYSAEEFLSGRVVYPDLIHEEDLEQIKREIHENKGSKHTAIEHQPYRARKKNGQFIWLRDYSTIIRNEDGEITHYAGYVVNITRLKEAELALVQSEHRHRLFFEKAPIGILHYNKDGFITDANSVSIKIFGSSRKKLVGLNLKTLPNKKFRDEIIKSLQGEYGYYEDLYTSHTGRREAFIRAYWIPLMNNKEVASGFCIIEDISGMKEADAEIRKMSRVIESTNQAVTITDLDTKIIYVNEALLKIGGFEHKDELLEKPVTTFMDEKSIVKLQEDVLPHLLKVGSYSGELQLKRKDESLYPVELNCAIIYDEAGNPEYLSATFNDISDRKQSEEELRDSETYLTHLFENVPTGIAIIDCESRKITDINPIGAQLIGLRKDKIIGELCHRFICRKGQDHCHATEQDLDVDNSQHSIVRADGSEVQIIKSIKKTKLKGRDHLIEIFTDITERIENERQMKAALEKAQESDRLKSAFLSNMSHEIRTPMNGILGFTELLKTPNLSGEQSGEFINIIERSGKRMLNTINDIIEISKLEAGEVKINVSEFSVNHMLKHLYDFFKPEAGNKGLSMILQTVPEEINDRIIADKSKIEGILTNLVKNSLKFTLKGSVSFGVEQIDGTMSFFVKDTGIGIPEDRQAAVFNRFEQADIEDKMAFEGSGLGLSISRAYVELLGGEIHLESEKDKGSKFYFTLPQISSAGKGKAAEETSGMATTFGKLPCRAALIVEDDEATGKYLHFLLKDAVGQLYFARSGKEVVQIYQSHEDIDIILMDMKLPEVDGYEATRRIREFDQHIKILAQSALAMQNEREKALKAGCNDFIAKPYNQKEIFEKIESVLSGS